MSFSLTPDWFQNEGIYCKILIFCLSHDCFLVTIGEGVRLKSGHGAAVGYSASLFDNMLFCKLLFKKDKENLISYIRTVNIKMRK